MSGRQSWRRPLALLLVVSVLITALLGFGAPHVAVARPVVVATGTSIAETSVASFHFETGTYDQVPVSTKITVTFHNADALQHTFTILNRSDWAFAKDASNGNISDQLAKHGTLIDLSANGGQTLQGTFRAPASGWYEFVCTFEGHYQSGMYGFIAFGENVPSNLSVGAGPAGPGLAVFIIVGTIVTLTVVAIVLGFVIGRRRGAVHEMPPERLGYPEPPGGTASPPEPPLTPPPAP